MKSHILWDYAGRLSSTIIQFVVSVILTRLLQPADYGLVGITMAINGVIAIFGNFGFASYIVQASNLESKVLSSIFWFNVWVGLGLYLGVLLMMPFAGSFFRIEGLADVMYYSGFNLVLSFVGVVPAALLTKEMQFKQMNIRNILIAVITGGVGITMAYAGFGVWALVWQSLISAGLMVLANFKLSNWRPEWFFRGAYMKECFQFGKFMFLSGLLEGIYGRLDVFIIGKVFNAASLGYYTRAQSLDGMIRSLSSGSLLAVLFPAFAKLKEDDDATIKLYYRYFEIICFVFCFLAGCFYLLSVPIYTLLFGEKWRISADYFQLMVTVGFVYPLSALMLTIIEARGNSKNFFYVEVLKKVVILPMYIVVFFYGIISYLYVFNIVYILALLLNLSFLNKELPIGFAKSTSILVQYMVSGLLLAVLLYQFLPYQDTVLGNVSAVLILAITYLGWHWYRGSSPVLEFKKQLKLT